MRAGFAELRLKHISAHTGMSAAVYWDANKLGAPTGAAGLTAGSAFMLCAESARSAQALKWPALPGVF